MIKGPLVVTVEGAQGSGKTTLIKILEEALDKAGYARAVVNKHMEKDLKKGGFVAGMPPIVIYEKIRK